MSKDTFYIHHPDFLGEVSLKKLDKQYYVLVNFHENDVKWNNSFNYLSKRLNTKIIYVDPNNVINKLHKELENILN